MDPTLLSISILVLLFVLLAAGMPIGGCGAFAAICGSSLATAATMAQIALPEMRRYNSDDRLATGSVAAGGTIGNPDPAERDHGDLWPLDPDQHRDAVARRLLA